MQALAATAGGQRLAAAGGAAPPPSRAVLPCPRPQAALRLAGSGQQQPLMASSSSAVFLRSSGGSSMQRCSGRQGCSRRLLQPRAVAAAEGGEAQPAAAEPVQQAPKIKPRPLSMIQRWRAFKFAVKEWEERMSQVPAIAAVLAALAAVRRQLQPLYDAAAWAEKQWAALLLLYNAFVAEETKQLWHWSRRFPKEAALWSAVPHFVGYFILTIFYQAFMPVSVTAAVLVPLWYSWVVWDAWWVSPVVLATLASAPLKWVPWADKCWIWPGLI